MVNIHVLWSISGLDYLKPGKKSYVNNTTVSMVSDIPRLE